ncbi:hypothetical protein N0V87_006108 [Didymella glomerata]|uniref:Uncharacterized protein n=1 Tax=Didymella glomerata TaxID=749621 RepID=A0A9W8WX89_9PLEO|nr:hypothetical protein N0V87_006108 [Didymella glomerata]
MQNSIYNVDLELKNMEHLTKEKIDIATPWQTYMKSHLLDIETKAKAGIKARTETDTESQLTKMMADLKTKEADLRKKETGKDKVNLDHKAKENIIKSKEADLKAKRAVYNTNNAGLRKKNDEIDVMVKNIANEKHATGKAALQQQLEAFEATRAKLEIERKTAETAKELADSARAQARDDKLEKQKIVSLKQREVKKVAAFKKAGAAVKIPPPV